MKFLDIVLAMKVPGRVTEKQWKKLSDSVKRAYVKLHPNSIFAEKYKKEVQRKKRLAAKVNSKQSVKSPAKIPAKKKPEVVEVEEKVNIFPLRRKKRKEEPVNIFPLKRKKRVSAPVVEKPVVKMKKAHEGFVYKRSPFKEFKSHTPLSDRRLINPFKSYKPADRYLPSRRAKSVENKMSDNQTRLAVKIHHDLCDSGIFWNDKTKEKISEMLKHEYGRKWTNIAKAFDILEKDKNSFLNSGLFLYEQPDDIEQNHIKWILESDPKKVVLFDNMSIENQLHFAHRHPGLARKIKNPCRKVANIIEKSLKDETPSVAPVAPSTVKKEEPSEKTKLLNRIKDKSDMLTNTRVPEEVKEELKQEVEELKDELKEKMGERKVLHLKKPVSKDVMDWKEKNRGLLDGTVKVFKKNEAVEEEKPSDEDIYDNVEDLDLGNKEPLNADEVEQPIPELVDAEDDNIHNKKGDDVVVIKTAEPPAMIQKIEPVKQPTPADKVNLTPVKPVVKNTSQKRLDSAVERLTGKTARINIDMRGKTPEEVKMARQYLVLRHLQAGNNVRYDELSDNDWKELLKSEPNYILQLKDAPKKVIYDTVKQNTALIDYLSEENQKKVVENDGLLLQHIEDPSDDVINTALDNNGAAIKFIENPSDDQQDRAIMNSIFAMRYIKNPSESAKETYKTMKAYYDEQKARGVKPSEMFLLFRG